jgi:hypothetical protein
MTYLLNNGFIQNKKGQAILELAIFGAILLTLLGVLISYGLRYNYQQRATQQAFRRALGTSAYSTAANMPVSVSHMVIEDRHIPDPTHPFAVGSITPFTGMGSVTRTAKMHETPDNDNELGVTIYDVNGQTFTFKNAAFRQENNIDSVAIQRYLLIYGTVQTWDATTGSWVYWEDGSGVCLSGDSPCSLFRYDRIRYIDDSGGEIMSYDAAAKQCRKIIDSEVCEDSCVRSGGSDCATTCSQPMAVPWYCGTNYVETDAVRHVYSFPFLDTLFAFAKGENQDKSMGIQSQDSIQEASTTATLRRTDNTGQAESRDVVTFNTHSERELVWKTYGDTSTNTNSQTVATDTQRDTDRIWRTPWN